MKIKFIVSPNFTARQSRKIRYVIIHYTGMRTAQAAIKRLKSRKHQVSCHYLIDNSGEIVQMVKDQDIAWHAGISSFGSRLGCNDFSIGIELEGTDHSRYTNSQYRKLAVVLRALMAKYPALSLGRIVGHQEIAPLRKKDPGTEFEWERIYAEVVRHSS